MELISGILSQSAPKAQLVQEAIPTLCDRLINATLLSDRRAAVLGLKAFSREYRESVVEYGLRGLVSALKKDIEDNDIVKPILETLLILFIRGEGDDDLTRNWISQQSRLQNGKYPSPILMNDVAIDQFSLWIADELSQNDDNIQSLITILETDDFYIRLYTIQLLEAIISVRSNRIKECILKLPFGISTLVATLHDTHEPVRNEAILLLMGLVNNNFNIQKLVAFENTFDTLFDIIEEEGGIRGSIFVQDCLSLITNLLKYNASNQKLFLETNCVPKLALLLGEPVNNANDIIVWNDQRLQNMLTCLEICRLFTSKDNESTKSNQDKLFKFNILFIVLKLVFSPITPNSIRSIALMTAADLIDGNHDIHFEFSQIDIPYLDPSLPTQLQKFDKLVPVTVALLNWCLFCNSVHTFDIRVAAAACLHAYFKNNSDSKSAFLEDQIQAYTDPTYGQETTEIPDGETDDIQDDSKNTTASEESYELVKDNDGLGSNSTTSSPVTAPTENKIDLEIFSPSSTTPFGNIFQVLMDYDSDSRLNPYKSWFACVVLMYLFEDSEENKAFARSVTTGNEDAGEEVMSAIPAISGILVTTLEYSDPRISMGYLMLLSVWLYEDFDAVNEFLSESSTVKSIATYLSNFSNDNTIVQGMAAILLGIAYEFSSKDSPIPRLELHTLLIKTIGKDNYALKLQQFKDSSLFKDFDPEAILDVKKDDTGLPSVFFDEIFTNMIKENFSRIRKAFIRDPNSEPHGRLSFELFEEIEARCISLQTSMDQQRFKADENELELKENINKITKEYEEVLDSFEKTQNELTELEDEHSDLADKYEKVYKEVVVLKQSKTSFEASSSEYHSQLQEALKNHDSDSATIKSLNLKLSESEKTRATAEQGFNKMTRDLFQLSREKNELEKQIKTVKKGAEFSAKQFENSKANYESTVSKLQNEINSLKATSRDINEELQNSLASIKNLQAQLKERADKNSNSEIVNLQLMEKLRSAAAAFQDMKAEKVDAENEKSRIKSETEARIAALLAQVQELEGVFIVLQNEKFSLEKRCNDLQDSSREDLKKSEEILKDIEESSLAKNELLLEEIDELKTKLNSVEEEFAAYRRENKEKIENLRTDNEMLQSALRDLDKSKYELQSRYDTLVSELEQLRISFAASKEEAEKRLSEHVSRHASKITDFEGKIKLLGETSDSLLKKLQETGASNKGKDDLIESRMKEIEELQNLNNELQNSKDILAAEKDELIKKNESILKSERENFDKVKERLELDLTESKHKFDSELREAESEIKVSHERTESIEYALQSQLKDFEQKLVDAEKSNSQLKESRVNDIANIEANRCVLKASLDELQKKFDQLVKTNKAIEKSADLREESLKSKDEIIKTGEERISSLELQLKDRKVELSEYLRELEEMKLQKVELDTSTETKEAKLAALTDETKQFKTDIKNSAKAFKTLQSKYDDDTKRLNSKISKLDSEIESLKVDLDQKTRDIENERRMLTENSSSAIKTYSEKISRLEESISSAEKQHEENLKFLNVEKEDLETRLNDYAVKISNLKSEKQESEDRECSLKEKSDSLIKKIDTQQKLIDSMKAKLLQKGAEIESQVTESSKKSSVLSSEVVSLKKEMSELENDVSVKDSKILDIEYQIEANKLILSKVTEDADKKKVLLEAAIKENEELKLKLGGIEAENVTTNIKRESEREVALSQLEGVKAAKLESETSLNEKLQKLQGSHNDLEKQLRKLEVEQNSVISEKKTLLEEIDTFKTKVKDNESSAVALAKEIDRSNSMKADFDSKASAHELQIETLAKASASMKDSIKSLEERNKELSLSVESKEEVELEKRMLLSDKQILEAKLKSLTSAHGKDVSEITKVTDENDSLKKDHEYSMKVDESKILSLESNNTKLSEELESMKLTGKEENEKLVAQISKLNSELEKLKKEMVPKSELDDLVLLMSEMDETSKKYKSKLKDLGEELSSDEDDDDDDDENEESDDENEESDDEE